MSKIVGPDWPHQAHEYRIGREKRSRALLWPMRSGKTKACIDKACFQFEHGNIEGVVVIAPNGVHLNWAMNEIPKWAWPEIGPHAVFAWETPKRGLVEQDIAFQQVCRSRSLKWFCTNMEALKHLDSRRAVKDFLAACHRKFMLIVSEAHHFGRAGSKRTHFARSLAHHAAYVQTETGTPILTGPLRAFSQFELLAPGALGFRTFGEFRDHYAEMEPSRPGSRRYMKVKQYQNLDELRERVAKWSSLVLREELRDMPPLIRTERPVLMTDRCRVAYLEMVSRHLAEIGEDMVTAKDGGPRLMKLQQMLHGYVMDSATGRVIDIDPDAAIFDAAIDEIKGTLPGKTLVWCRYKEDIRRLMVKLGGNWNPVEYHGDLTPRQREANRHRFLKDKTVNPLIGTPDTGGEGLDFSAASAVLFFSVPPNARMISQAEERATVKGGKSVAVVRMRHYGTVDDRMWEIINGNISIADTVTGHGLRELLLRTEC